MFCARPCLVLFVMLLNLMNRFFLHLYNMIRGFLARNKGCIWFWSFSLRVLGRFLDHETLKHETDLSSFKNQPRDQNSMGRENHTDYHHLRAKMKGRPGKNDMRSRD